MIFFIVFLLAIFFTLLENKISVAPELLPRRKKSVFIGAKFLGLMMFILCALRGIDVGIDTSHYYESFKAGIGRFVEVGYWLIRHITLLFGGSFQVFLFLYALAALCPLYKFLSRESANVSFSLLIYLSFSNYFYPEAFNTIRAAAAIGFFVLGLSYWSQKEYKLGLPLFIVSCLFHISSIVACVIVVIAQVVHRISRKTTYIAIIVSIVFGIVFQTGFSEYAETISLWLAGVSGNMAEYYTRYFSSLEESEFNMVGTLSNMLPFSMFAILLYDKENSDNLFYKLFLIGVIMSNVFISVALVYRITMFFTTLLIIVLPNTLKRQKGFYRTLSLSLIVLMLLWYVYKLFISTSDNMAGIVPYSFCF